MQTFSHFETEVPVIGVLESKEFQKFSLGTRAEKLTKPVIGYAGHFERGVER